MGASVSAVDAELAFPEARKHAREHGPEAAIVLREIQSVKSSLAPGP